ncbi:MAG TPA: DUF2795 domain-containing protein [Candidatus Limnocylindrales bacterium]
MNTEDVRGNSKHGPRLDDQLAREVEGQLKGGSGGGRADEWREPEPPADGEPEPGWIPAGHHGVDSGDDRDPDRREIRARIGGYLPRDVFPAGRAKLIAAARENRATDDVIDTLGGLAPNVTYPDARELWKALDLLSAR